MHNGTRDGGGPRLRPPGLLAVTLAGMTLLAVACGGGSSPAPAALTAYGKALAYAQCMRAHGEPGFPDPDSKGNLLIDGKKDHLVGGSVMASAQKACQHLLPKSAPLTAAQQRRLLSQALKFVRCMRAHGLTDMPDPSVDSQGISMRLPVGSRPGSPQLQSAQRACQKLLPGGPP